MTDLSPLEKLDNSIESLKGRIAKARDKLDIAQGEGSEHVDVLRGAMEKLEAKLQDALEERRALAPDSAPAVEESQQDPAAAAIARAQAKAAAMAEMSAGEKLDANIASLETRAAKAREKLLAAQQEGADHVDVLTTAVEKLEAKLKEARQERAQLKATESTGENRT